jgi:hypothetical protein
VWQFVVAVKEFTGSQISWFFYFLSLSLTFPHHHQLLAALGLCSPLFLDTVLLEVTLPFAFPYAMLKVRLLCRALVPGLSVGDEGPGKLVHLLDSEI